MEVSCGTVWNDCLEVIRENVGEENFNTWFKPIAPYVLTVTSLLYRFLRSFFMNGLKIIMFLF